MFSSSQFRENLNYFQQLLAEGVFDLSLSGIRPEDRKTLQQLVVSNLSKSQWVEYYNSLKVLTKFFILFGIISFVDTFLLLTLIGLHILL